MEIFDLFSLLSSNKAIIEYLLGKKLLFVPDKCGRCNNIEMILQPYTAAANGYVFRCTEEACKARITVLKDSWFEGTQLTLKQCLTFFFFFIHKTSSENLVFYAKIYGSDTIANRNRFTREISVDHAIYNYDTILSGPGVTIK